MSVLAPVGTKKHEMKLILVKVKSKKYRIFNAIPSGIITAYTHFLPMEGFSFSKLIKPIDVCDELGTKREQNL